MVLREGFDFSAYAAEHGTANLILTIATTIGALCGTSTVTTFSEVNAGVAAGGRTGLTSVFCGDFKKINGSSWVIADLFVAMLVLTH